MKVFVISPDNRGRIDGSVQANLLNHFPEKVTNQAAADVVIVPISLYTDYSFNPKLNDITKPIVIIDFLEMEWCYFDEKKDTHIFGKNTRDCRWLGPNWYPFDGWSERHPP